MLDYITIFSVPITYACIFYNYYIYILQYMESKCIYSDHHGTVDPHLFGPDGTKPRLRICSVSNLAMLLTCRKGVVWDVYMYM